jgi:uncharacterized protein (TIGR03067 family)
MIRELVISSIGVLLMLVSVGAAGRPDRAEDLYGEWDLIGMVHRGVVQDPAAVKGGAIRIERGKWFLRYKETDQWVDLALEIRPGAGTGTGEVDLIEIDSTRYLGRYELKSGTLRIVVSQRKGKPRPAKFEAEKDKDVTLYILRRPET